MISLNEGDKEIRKPERDRREMVCFSQVRGAKTSSVSGVEIESCSSPSNVELKIIKFGFLSVAIEKANSVEKSHLL